MSKKKAKSKKKEQPVPLQQEKPVVANDEEKQFDFGGIPDRNLKKNLGCG